MVKKDMTFTFFWLFGFQVMCYGLTVKYPQAHVIQYWLPTWWLQNCRDIGPHWQVQVEEACGLEGVDLSLKLLYLLMMKL